MSEEENTSKFLSKPWTIYIPAYIIDFISETAREFGYSPSLLITKIFLGLRKNKFFVISASKVSARNLIEGTLLLYQKDLENKLRKIYVDNIIFCPLKIEHALILPQRFLAMVKISELIEFLISIGIMAVGFSIGLETWYEKEMKVKLEEKELRVYARADVFDSINRILWFIASEEKINNPYFLLKAYLYKIFFNAREVRALIIQYKEGKALPREVIISDQMMENALNDLELDLRGTNLLLYFVKNYVKKEKIPLWSNECDNCPFKDYCSRT